MNLDYLATNYRRFGLLGTLQDLFISAINNVVHFRIQVVYIFEPTSENVHGFVIRPLSKEELLEHPCPENLDMTKDFVIKALENGDECIGAYEGDQLVSYTWCARRPVEFSSGLTATFPDTFIHPYKGWTLPAARGRGALKAICFWLVRHYKNAEGKKVLSAIDLHNLGSRKSVESAGAKPVGYWT